MDNVSEERHNVNHTPGKDGCASLTHELEPLEKHPRFQEVKDAVTRSKSFSLTRYVSQKWLPVLGTHAYAIIGFLRSKCYNNLKNSEKRASYKCKISEIAQACSISSSTVRRTFKKNTALRKFITVKKEYGLHPKSQNRYQLENTYYILMDDPLHPSDVAEVQARLREIDDQQKQAELNKAAKDNAARQRRAGIDDLKQKATQEKSATAGSRGAARPDPHERPPIKIEEGASHNGRPPCHNDRGACQIDGANKEDSYPLNHLYPPNPSATPRELMHSLSKRMSPRRYPSEEAWAALPSEKKQEWLTIANKDAIEKGSIDPRPEAIESLAKGLFWADLKRQGTAAL